MIKRQEFEDDYKCISYISDLHLLHRFKYNKAETLEDEEYITKSIIKEIKQNIHIP